MLFKRPVFITSSPNTQATDVLLGLRLLLQPWNWRADRLSNNFKINLLKYLFSADLDDKSIYLLDSGRASLYFILKSLGIGPGDEVIVPAFTCLAVANPIRWTGATPIYVDVDATTFNMNLDLLPAKITSRTKAILAQHTFGLPVDMDKLNTIIDKRNILIVEDSAHALGGSRGNSKLGTIGDVALLAFGIDKVISGVRGGGVLVNFKKLHAKGFQTTEQELDSLYQKLPKFPLNFVWKALINSFVWQVVTPTYFWGFGTATLGRVILRILFILGIIGNVTDQAENVGDRPQWLPAQISPALAKLADHQLSRIDQMNDHRRQIAQLYSQQLNLPLDPQNTVYQKYSLLVKDAQQRKQIYNAAKKIGILIGDWLPRPLYAKFSSTAVYEVLSYKSSDNPVAEDVASRIINLPTSTNINSSRATELAKLVAMFI